MQKKKAAATAPAEAVRDDSPERADFPIPSDGSTGSAEGEVVFDVKPSELVSIVADNRVLALQTGITGITIRYNV